MAEFTEEELAAEAATIDTVEQAPEQSAQERARDEAGRFAAAEEGEHHDEQPERKNGKVPHQALHQEREGHKQTRAQLAEAQATLRSIAEMRARITQPQAEQEAPPPADDSSGIEYLQKRVNELGQREQQRDQREQLSATEVQRMGVLSNQLTASEAAYIQAKPDYNDAAQHLLNARAKQLQMLGVTGQQLHEQLRDETADLTETAINLGRDPADLIYEYAQSYGYAGQGNGQQQNGVHPMLAAIAKGQSQRSFGNGRAAASQGDQNLNEIASMDEAEFSRNYSSNADFRALVDRIG